MTMLRSGGTTWLVGGQPGEHLFRRSSLLKTCSRLAGVAALAGGLCAVLLEGRAFEASGAAGERRHAVVLGKDESRLAAWPPSTPASAPPRPSSTKSAEGKWTLLAGRAAGPIGNARFSNDPVITGSLEVGHFKPVAPPAPKWREQEFAQVAALDGRTLAAEGVRIRLTGLDLPAAEEVCRTLDGRLEACAVRAATQLELMTRFRKVTCRYRFETPSEGVGSCRIGSSDLAERVARTGYGRRVADTARVASAASRPIAN